MKRSRSLLKSCLAGSALATVVALAPPAGAAPIGPVYTKADATGLAASSQKVEFDVILPLRNKDKLSALLARQQDKSSADYHKWLTPAQFGVQFGPDRTAMVSLARELSAQGFVVRQQSRSLHLAGTAGAVKAAFGTDLTLVHGADGRTHTVALNGLKLSPSLTAAGAFTLAFNPSRITARTMSAIVPGAVPDNRYGQTGGYWYDDLREAYAYPAVNATAPAFDGTVKPLNGSGATIAALMDSDMLDSDVHLMFEHEHYRKHGGSPIPAVAARRYVSGAVPGSLTNDFAEASLDIQEEIGGASGSSVILYDIPDLSDGSILSGYLTINEYNETDVVSSSFGLCEKYYSPAYNGVSYGEVPTLYHELFMQGNAQGITFLASSGDEAGRECISEGYFFGATKAVWIPGASSPATDPNVTGVGGTNLVTTYQPDKLTSRYKEENAYADPRIPVDYYGLGTVVKNWWWGAGGGPSVLFAEPSYQTALHTATPMRATPDIGMQVGGCPGGARQPCDGGDLAVNGNGNRQRSYAVVYLQGGRYGLIGTSVSSPEFASAMALMVELHGRQGNVNPYLYSFAGNAATYHLNIPGYNAVHPNNFPDPTYNYTVGLGTPYVANLIGVPPGTPLAGSPQSATNY